MVNATARIGRENRSAMVSRGIHKLHLSVTQAWRKRMCLGLLVLLTIGGLAVAAVEKYQADRAFAIWTRGYEVTASVLDPARERTHRWVMTARKMNELWNIQSERDQLSRDLARTRFENDRLREELGRLQRLSGLGRWASPSPLRFVPADVTGLITTDESMLLTINRGRADGVGARDPVVALKGLVGLVRSVQEHSAQVQAITDPMSVVGAATRDTRARGALYGRGRGKPLEFLPENEVENFNIGSELITARFENSNFPKGITIGTIKKRDLNLYGIPVGVVESAVAFDAIEEVLVIVPSEAANGATPPAGSLGTIRIVMPHGDVLDDATRTLVRDRPLTGTLAVIAAATHTLFAINPTTPTLRSAAPTTPTLRAVGSTSNTLHRVVRTSATAPRRDRDAVTTAPRRRAQPDRGRTP